MSCRMCNGTNISCRICKYGGNICSRAGLQGLSCDLPFGHKGPHTDKELQVNWYGGYGGYIDSDHHPNECRCDLRSIMISGCKCGGT